MAQKKESFFWTSYSDLMTSLFFVMLVLFILVIVLLHKRMEATETQLQEIKKVEESTKDLSKDYFEYRPEYKKYVLNIKARYPRKQFDINSLISEDKDALLTQIVDAGKEIQQFLLRHKTNQYLLIIEGQSSSIRYDLNYQLSYERALALTKFWMEDSGIEFGDNCEILISGSGDGTIDTHSMRENEDEDLEINQRFLIHILPKNIFEHTNESH